MKIVVTGGAGFIGSALAEKLSAKHDVLVLDNLTSGKREYVSSEVEFKKIDLLRSDAVKFLKGADAVYHLAANPDVRLGERDHQAHLQQNVLVTWNVLEACRKADCRSFLFTSSSTVYGVPTQIPTPESYGPCLPISLYGASKLAAESFISAYCDNYGLSGVACRMANIVGGRGHGVIKDFIAKLRADSTRLEILGDGRQSKSYVHVNDCVNALLACSRNSKKKIMEVFNISNVDRTSVKEIAEIVASEMHLHPRFEYTGKQAWKGDVPQMLLDSRKLRALGWKPRLNSREAVEKACGECLREKN